MIKKRTVAVVMAMALMFTGCGSGEKKSNKSSDNADVNVTKEASSDSETSKDSGETKTKKSDEKSSKASDADIKTVEKVQTKATTPEYKYTATKTGSISARSLYTVGGIAYKSGENKTCNIYLADGSLFPQDGVLSNVDYLGNGLYKLRKSSDNDVNTVGLVDAKGEVLIPFEAASIDWVKSDDETNRRFVKVIYATEPVESKDECFIYFTSKVIALGPTDGDLFYKGYAKVYDLEKKQFIPDLKITNRDSYCLSAVKGGVVYEDEKGKKTLYSASGKQVVSVEKYDLKTDGSVAVVKDNNNYTNTVYDGEGSILLKTKDSITEIGGQGSAFAMYDSVTKKRYLADYNGNKLSDFQFDAAYDISAGIVRINGSASDLSSLINFDGSYIVQDKKSIRDIIPGYFYYEAEDGKKVIVTADGEICPECQSHYDLVAYDAEGKYFVWNTKEYSLSINKDAVRVASIGLVYAKDADGKYGLYDLFTGNMILESKYDEVRVAGTFAYGFIKAEEKWDIYQISTNVPKK